MRVISGRLLDQLGVTVGVVHVTEGESGFCSGEIELDVMPDWMVSVFRRFEEIVDGQMFSFLDDIEAEIARIGIRFAAGDEGARSVDDLQIHPSTGGVSFHLASESPRNQEGRNSH
jgi:hypothetical protein